MNPGQRARAFMVWVVLAAAVLGLCLPGCRPSSVTYAAAETERQTLTIAWIPKALDNPVFDIGRKGAELRAAELSAAGPVNVEILYVGSVSSDVGEQARVVEDAIARGVDAIAISCNDPVGCIDPINRAVEEGIPVMTWDSDSPKSKRFTYMSLNNRMAGRAAAELLVGAMGPQGKVAILTGVPGAYNLEERIRGFKEGIALYPDIEIVTTVATNDDINLSVQVVEETMQAIPELDGWFFVGVWPLLSGRGAMPLWEKAVLNDGLKTVAFDSMPEELELLDEGYVSGLIDQKPWGWGYDTVQIVYDYVVNGQEFPAFVNSGFNIITANNVKAMMEMWENNDFSGELPSP
jgi:ribose transport system substrate-binding protein